MRSRSYSQPMLPARARSASAHRRGSLVERAVGAARDYASYAVPVVSYLGKRAADYALQSRGKRRKIVIKPSYTGSHNGTAKIIKKKKVSRKIKARPCFSEREKKSIRAVARGLKWCLREVDENQQMSQLACDQNKVAWGYINPGLDYGDTLTWLTSKVIGYYDLFYSSATGLVDQVAAVDPTITGLVTRTTLAFPIKVEITARLHLKNNSNFQAEVTLYVVRCNQDTSNSATEDIDDRLREKYNSTASGGNMTTKEDNFAQYYSVSGFDKNKKWDIIDKQQMTLAGGQESKNILRGTKMLTNTDFETGSANLYKKGDIQFLYRIQGVPSHGQTSPSNRMMANGQVDYYNLNEVKIYTKGTGQIGGVTRNIISNAGFVSSGTDVPIQADVTSVTPAVFTD